LVLGNDRIWTCIYQYKSYVDVAGVLMALRFFYNVAVICPSDFSGNLFDFTAHSSYCAKAANTSGVDTLDCDFGSPGAYRIVRCSFGLMGRLAMVIQWSWTG